MIQDLFSATTIFVSTATKIAKCRAISQEDLQFAERLSRGDVVGEQHAAHGLVHQLGLVNGNYHTVGWHLAGLDDDVGDPPAQRPLLFDRPSFV
jgi:hypothetical protein